jgi:hypothetical protein
MKPVGCSDTFPGGYDKKAHGGTGWRIFIKGREKRGFFKEDLLWRICSGETHMNDRVHSRSMKIVKKAKL